MSECISLFVLVYIRKLGQCASRRLPETREMGHLFFLTFVAVGLGHYWIRAECPHLDSTLEKWSEDRTWDAGKVSIVTRGFGVGVGVQRNSVFSVNI